MRGREARFTWQHVFLAAICASLSLCLPLTANAQGSGPAPGMEALVWVFLGGAAVSVAALIGFVGLIIPHLLRLLIGPDHRLLVPAAALGGAAFLVACDTIARTLLGGRELPVGAITAL